MFEIFSSCVGFCFWCFNLFYGVLGCVSEWFGSFFCIMFPVVIGCSGLFWHVCKLFSGYLQLSALF